jgi:hypothetical protein
MTGFLINPYALSTQTVVTGGVLTIDGLYSVRTFTATGTFGSIWLSVVVVLAVVILVVAAAAAKRCLLRQLSLPTSLPQSATAVAVLIRTGTAVTVMTRPSIAPLGQAVVAVATQDKLALTAGTAAAVAVVVPPCIPLAGLAISSMAGRADG